MIIWALRIHCRNYSPDRFQSHIRHRSMKASPHTFHKTLFSFYYRPHEMGISCLIASIKGIKDLDQVANHKSKAERFTWMRPIILFLVYSPFHNNYLLFRRLAAKGRIVVSWANLSRWYDGCQGLRIFGDGEIDKDCWYRSQTFRSGLCFFGPIAIDVT